METLDISYEVGPLPTAVAGQATIGTTVGQAATAAAPTAGQATSWVLSSALNATLQGGPDGSGDPTEGAPFDGRMPVNAKSAYVENVRYSAVPLVGGTVRAQARGNLTVHGETAPARRVRSSPALLEQAPEAAPPAEAGADSTTICVPVPLPPPFPFLLKFVSPTLFYFFPLVEILHF